MRLILLCLVSWRTTGLGLVLVSMAIGKSLGILDGASDGMSLLITGLGLVFAKDAAKLPQHDVEDARKIDEIKFPWEP